MLGGVQGVYLTLEQQPDGTNKLLRIRFNRNLFSKRAAEAWWTSSRQDVIHRFRIASGVDRSISTCFAEWSSCFACVWTLVCCM